MKAKQYVLLFLIMSALNPFLSLPAKAQMDPDEAYDPFSDYSEFDEASEEEADINFFRNGRFFTVGLAGGMRGFTENFDKTYSSAPTFGLFLSYFMDLRSAFSLGFMTGDHGLHFDTNLATYSGTVSFSSFNFDYKYYFSTQNITRGLADLNPYLLLGFSQFHRTQSVDGVSSISGSARDETMGVDLGLGLEIPLMRRKAYLGIQGQYHFVTFPDENKEYFSGNERLTHRVNGDIFDMLLIIGMNF